MKNITAEQVRKILDKAYFKGYSMYQYPIDDDIWEYLDRLDEITIYDYLENGHQIAWFSDLYSEHPVDDVLYDITQDRFLTEEEKNKILWEDLK